MILVNICGMPKWRETDYGLEVEVENTSLWTPDWTGLRPALGGAGGEIDNRAFAFTELLANVHSILYVNKQSRHKTKWRL